MTDFLLAVLHVASAVAVLISAGIVAMLACGAFNLRDGETTAARGERRLMAALFAAIAALLLARLFL